MEQTMQKKEDTSWTLASLMVYVRILLMGMYFGVVLVKADVIRWERINDMFMFREPDMYLIMGTAVLVGMIGMQIIKRFNIKTIDGEPIAYQPKPYHRGIISGGVIFGMGWAITGACPGPIYAQLGLGAWQAIITLGGALAGMYLYGHFQDYLPH
ncbi:MAG TPA: DUF6691 family protein [Anaerolineae bacterium]|nr:DUF6691 family protein [Anaerolineae bacterium]